MKLDLTIGEIAFFLALAALVAVAILGIVATVQNTARCERDGGVPLKGYDGRMVCLKVEAAS